MSVTIRPLLTNDASTFQVLRLQALEHDPDAFLSVLTDEKHKATNRFAQEIVYSSLISPFGYYGCFIDDHLVGYVLISSTNLGKQQHAAFLYNLYFDTHHRRQGLAQQLVTFVIDILQQYHIEWLYASCIASNQTATAFYHKLGFVDYGLRPRSVKWQNTYDDELELALSLQS